MANKEHIQILSKGVTEWNEWRSRHPELLPDLSEEDLSGQQLQHIDFHQVNLKGAQLDFGNFTSADFSNSILNDATITESNLRCTIFLGAHLENCDFTNSELTTADLSNSKLNNANFERANLEYTIFKKANLSSANFEQSILLRTVFDTAIMKMTNFSETLVEFSTFTNTTLEGADVRNSIFKNCNFSKAKFHNSLIRNAHFLDSILTRAQFKNAKGGANKFTGSDLANTSFQFADITDSCFRQTVLNGSNFNGAKIADSKFTKSNLSNSTFCNADACRCVFFQSNISECNFTNTNMTETDLREANMSFSNFNKSNMTNVIFDRNSQLQHILTITAFNLHNIKNKKKYTTRFLKKLHFFNLKIKMKNKFIYPFREFNVYINNWIKKRGLRISSKYDIIESKYRGIRVESCHGSQRFKIIAQDRSYIEERMASGIWWERLTYKMWYYCSDCGQSMFSWGMLSLTLAFTFGILYYSIGGNNFNTAFLKGADGNPGFWALQYYSIVTFTTLGFGDIIPKTGVAAFLVTLEVITGYIMLGGLIAIFANRLAKRND